MIETECFRELNHFFINGVIVSDLRKDGGTANNAHLNSQHHSKMGEFFSRLFRRKVWNFYLKIKKSLGRKRSAFWVI